MERRAASIHLHVDGQKGPELHDVVNASLKVLQTFVSRCHPPQLGVVLQNTLKCLDDLGIWGDARLCRWYADRITKWGQYQYRYAVPTRLVDELVSVQDSSEATMKHKTLIYMITNILTAPHPLINLATTEIIGKLSQTLLRRVAIDSQDELLQPLIECISALGTHMYYADQIQDLVEELVARIVNVQLNGVPGKGKNTSDPAREAALCSLLACLSGLTGAADKNATRAEGKSSEETDEEGSRQPSENTTTTIRASRRNKVSPESWQETLALLCESNYRIRAMYARALASFVRQEVKPEPFVQKEEATEGPMLSKIKVVVDPAFKASSRPSILVADPVSRFLNALHGSIFSLVTAQADGVQRQSSSALDELDVDAPMANITIVPPSTSNLPSPAAKDVLDPIFSISPVTPSSPSIHPTNSTAASSIMESPRSSNMPLGIANGSSQHRYHHGHRGRTLSIAMSLLEPANNPSVPSPTLSDFALLRELLLCAHQQVPTRALLTGVPMLLALDKVTRSAKGLGSERTKAARELLCVVWMTVGNIWDILPVVETSKRAFEELQPHLIPQLDHSPLSRLHDREEPIDFPSNPAEVQVFPISPCIDPEVVLPALASSPALQAITGLDRSGLLRRFAIEWTVELALKECKWCTFSGCPSMLSLPPAAVEQVASQDILRGDASFLKLSPALMHIENLSLASIAHSGPAVGVSDLRDALSGRRAISNPALVSGGASISTYDRASSVAHGRGSNLHPLSALKGNASSVQHPAVSRIKARKGQPNEVRDVLNKLGIGKQSSSPLLRAPFPAQKSPSFNDSKRKGKEKEKEASGGDETDTNGNPSSSSGLLNPPY
jgi:protein EFR3